MTFEDSGIILAYFGVGFAIVSMGFLVLCIRHVVKKSEDYADPCQIMNLPSQSNPFSPIGGNVAVALIMAGSAAYFTSLNGWAGCLMGLIGLVYFIAKRKYKLPTKSP